ncbi:hypothetical protein F511_13130 [Dorcoceras hygrometricum]|uniref:C2 domain-containing protein n=1 Tax=Dorcoceras hygrometricum TaxID=472368 RepID=A0A2Z7CYC0_9LAMI|nr:hypothetical protein F511_13130 [Dorcoceras hygrometricum]
MNMETARFTYNPISDPEPERSFSGILEIHVHHARNIHNICIYDNQDVYAKFSLTYNPDDVISTTVIDGGGKNPEFNEDLIMKINQMDAVLKCEIWMLSRAKNFMEDQLLGFALVPVSSVLGKGKVTQDFNLSSTDLFHSPAGTVKLSLSLTASTPLNRISVPFADSVADSSTTCELLVDKKISEEYSRIEFPDINVVNENQQMVSEYVDLAENGALLRPWPEKADGLFLYLGVAPNMPINDYEMAGNSSEGCHTTSTSPDGSLHNSGLHSSTITILSEDQNLTDTMEKRSHVFSGYSTSLDDNGSVIVETSISKKNDNCPFGNELNYSSKDEEINEERNKHAAKLASSVKFEAEESAMQQQIVDMYMRSMQQFTDSLAKMKLPMDLNKPQTGDNGDSVPNPHENTEIENKRKDGSRVFYGSRAFF